jgi:hypothetical protein
MCFWSVPVFLEIAKNEQPLVANYVRRLVSTMQAAVVLLVLHVTGMRSAYAMLAGMTGKGDHTGSCNSLCSSPLESGIKCSVK